jgi:hypothetical protein
LAVTYVGNMQCVRQTGRELIDALSVTRSDGAGIGSLIPKESEPKGAAVVRKDAGDSIAGLRQPAIQQAARQQMQHQQRTVFPS